MNIDLEGHRLRGKGGVCLFAGEQALQSRFGVWDLIRYGWSALGHGVQDQDTKRRGREARQIIELRD
jgi:hypothetical protein